MMSHFTVTVCLSADTTNVEEALNGVLAPWDENRAVERYRDFEEGGPTDFWWVSSVRRGAEHHRDGTGVLPHYPDDPHGFKHDGQSSKYPEDVQRAEFADDAAWAQKLGDNPTWSDVVDCYNAKWGHGTALAEADDQSDSETMYVDEESRRAFTWSTRNRDAKWDWWCIGGRWRNSLHAKQGVQASALIMSDPHYTEQYRKPGDEVKKWAGNGLRCDGGPIGLLDFESMRAEKAAEALDLFEQWEKVCAFTPHAEPWSYFYGLVKAGELDIDQARERYRIQPRIERARKNDDLKWYDDVVERFMPGKEQYIANARRDAVPGYALITLDGKWLAPGEMGWFGMSTDEPGTVDAYKTEANAYLEDLLVKDPEAIVVQIDCHI